MARRTNKEAAKHGWRVGEAGGSWWVWDSIGNVLGMGEDREEALEAALSEHGGRRRAATKRKRSYASRPLTRLRATKRRRGYGVLK